MRLAQLTLRTTIGVLTVALASASPAWAAGPEQNFAEENSYQVRPFNGGKNLQVTRLGDAGPGGAPALSIRFDSVRDNSGALVTWSFPAEVLDGRAFSLQIHKGRLPYVRAAFLAGGKQVCRLNYFNLGGPSWTSVELAYGVRGSAASTEPANIAAGQKIDGIALQLCGKEEQTYEVEIASFVTAELRERKPASAPPATANQPPGGQKPTEGIAQDFDKDETYSIKPFFGATDVRSAKLEKPGPTGRPALELTADCPKENAGIDVQWMIPPTVLDGKTLSLQVMAPRGPIPYVRCEFLDADGKRVCRNTYFNAGAAQWRAITFSVGGKTGAAAIEPATVPLGRQVAAIRLQFGGKADKQLHTVISDFSVAGQAQVRRAKPIAADSQPTVSAGNAAIWLDAAKNHSLTGVRIGNRHFEQSISSTYPTFTFLDADGKQQTLAADAPGISATAQRPSADRANLRYAYDGTTVELAYSVSGGIPRCEISVLEEGHQKLVAVGADKFLGTELSAGDYGILPNGNLYPRLSGAAPRSFRRLGNSDNAVLNFVAARLGQQIVFYKPLTASQEMQLATDTADGAEMIWFGGQLYFRPSKVKNPATKLCHRTLGWQLETAGDENRDGTVDWVDCAVAYRDRYLKRNPALDPSIRDSLKFYHGVPGDTYEQLAGAIEKMDYCSTLWWVKGAMKTLIEPGSEAHPYTVAPDAKRGDRAAVSTRIAAERGRVGIYYGHDYLDNDAGDWPAELIKLDEGGQPQKYYEHRGHRLLYKDNIRGLATGQLPKHYAEILRVCQLGNGDPVMLDTFTAYARQGYHPDYPATPQLETAAKRELCRWFKQQGLSIAGESVIEGTEDSLDFGALLYTNMRGLQESQFWYGDTWTPLLGVIYHGRTYTGVSVYEFRQPDPNWAASLVTGCSMWQWSTGHYPEMYSFGARMFFNQNSAWIPNADADIIDVDRTASEYSIRFSNGNTLWADPARDAWRLKIGDVLYDGFTPFNSRGVMAILRQGDFDFTLPVKEMLEIIPSQPYRELLDVKIEAASDGRIRVRGNFSKQPWKMKWYHRPEGAARDVVEMRDAAPVLMLRRVAAK